MKRIISKILKEEFNNRISRGDYLNKIVDILVDDTIFDFKGNEIRFPFPPPFPPIPSLFHFSPSSFLSSPFLGPRVPPSSFSKYCKDMYGLTENEMDYVWNEYRNIIFDKINNKESINESTGKISREDYLNKVVDYLVEDTIVDSKKNEIRYPFLSSSAPLLYPFPPSLLILPSFRNYNKDMYGLTENDMGYVWNEYKNIILDKINEWKNRVSKGF